MEDVFISYAKARRELTEELAGNVHKAGYSVWWDTNLLPNEKFRKEIDEKLDGCAAAVIIWTPEATNSDWVLSEAEHAYSQNKLINTHSSDFQIQKLPKPFNQIHSVEISNRSAIIEAISSLIQNNLKRKSDTPKREAIKYELRASFWIRRRTLIAGGILLIFCGYVLFPDSEFFRKIAVRISDRSVRTFQEIGAGDRNYQDEFKTVAISPDGAMVLSDGPDYTLKLWELGTGRLLSTFLEHKQPVNSVAFSPNGRTALSCSIDGEMNVWNVENGSLIRNFKKGSAHWCGKVFFLPGGKTVLSENWEELKLWEFESGALIRSFGGGHDLSVSPDGKTAATTTSRHSLTIWNVETGTQVRKIGAHADTILSLEFSPDGKFLLSGSNDRTMRLWDVITGRQLQTFRNDSTVWSTAFTKDGKNAFSGDDYGNIKVWDIRSGKLMQTIIAHSGYIRDFIVSSDGKYLLSVSSDHTIKLWNMSFLLSCDAC